MSKPNSPKDSPPQRSALRRFLRRQRFDLNPFAEQRAIKRGDVDAEELKAAMELLERKGKMPKDPG